MHKIGIRFNKKDFEYDVYSLVKAFYPRSETVNFYEWDETPEADGYLRLTYDPERIALVIEQDGQEVFRKVQEITYDRDRTETKNALKQLVYQGLQELTGKSLPWGTLTGIRPTKIPMHLLETGKSNAEIAVYMRDTYYSSREKTALAISIANRERAILRRLDYVNGYSLYVGIPFCPSICLYCSFGSHPMKVWEKQIDAYLDALCRELTFIGQEMEGRSLNTIYIGGGTPTSLSAVQMNRLLKHITGTFPLENVQEFTVEAGRPDSIDEEKLRVIRQYPVTRISVNPQTMNQKTLDLVGRKHTVEDTIRIFQLARGLGFDNINMDLIIGLPGEDKSCVEHTLEEIKKLEPESLTVHSLALKRATRLNLFREQFEEISFENSGEIMDKTAAAAQDMGMNPYYLYRQKNIAGNFENVGYSKVDKEGIYNILIMEEKQTIMAAGAGASTKFVFQNGERIERVENVKDVKQYMERLDEMLERKRKGIENYLI